MQNETMDVGGKFDLAHDVSVTSSAGPQMLSATEAWEQVETTTTVKHVSTIKAGIWL